MRAPSMVREGAPLASSGGQTVIDTSPSAPGSRTSESSVPLVSMSPSAGWSEVISQRRTLSQATAQSPKDWIGPGVVWAATAVASASRNMPRMLAKPPALA
jgi:hypothetical protein